MSRYYTDEFKQTIVKLKQSRKTTQELVREYKGSKTTIQAWKKQYRNSGKFGTKENLSENEKKLRVLRKENKQLKMEVDILKQAALILARKKYYISRNKIRNVMKKYNLVSNDTLKLQKKTGNNMINEDAVENTVNQEFTDRKPLEVVVSDLTYVKVAGKWNYICILLDLCNHKIIRSAVSKNKRAMLVKNAFFSEQTDLRRINLFHTDRSSEFKNAVIESILIAFGIHRSLSTKDTPVDNAVAESMYSIIKTEFAFNHEFVSLNELELLWFDYVNWNNNIRIHGSLGYLSPAEYGDHSLVGF